MWDAGGGGRRRGIHVEFEDNGATSLRRISPERSGACAHSIFVQLTGDFNWMSPGDGSFSGWSAELSCF